MLLALLLITQFVAATWVLTGHTRNPDAPAERTVRVVGADGPFGDRIRSATGAAVSAVERFWGTDWTSEIVVVATDSPAQFASAAGLDPAGGWEDIAAVAVADRIDPATRTVSGQRIVLAPGAPGMSDSALRLVLAHELFHLAVRADTAPDAPRWLTEGVADFVARPAAPLPPEAAEDPALPTDAELEVTGPARSAGYDRAWWFARFIAEDYGVDALRRLYRDACAPGHPDFGTAVGSALGVDMDVLRAGWLRWLTGSG